MPPAPAHVSVNMLSAKSAPLLADPLVGLLPDHASEATQEDALLVVQVRVVACPYEIADGDASSEILGVSGG